MFVHVDDVDAAAEQLRHQGTSVLRAPLDRRLATDRQPVSLGVLPTAARLHLPRHARPLRATARRMVRQDRPTQHRAVMDPRWHTAHSGRRARAAAAPSPLRPDTSRVFPARPLRPQRSPRERAQKGSRQPEGPSTHEQRSTARGRSQPAGWPLTAASGARMTTRMPSSLELRITLKSDIIGYRKFTSCCAGDKSPPPPRRRG